MKKFTALLLAGVMSVGVFSLVACNQAGGNGGEEGNGKIPQLPDGLVLKNVAFEKMEATANSFNDGMATSKNMHLQSYAHSKYYREVDGEYVLLNDEEYCTTANYLEKDGKTYAEVTYDNYQHYKYEEGLADEYSYERVYENKGTVFLKDKNVGYINSSKDSGHRIIKDQSSDTDINDEWNEAYDNTLRDIYVNFEDYFGVAYSDYNYYNYDGIRILDAAPYSSSYFHLPYSRTIWFNYNVCGVDTHIRYNTMFSQSAFAFIIDESAQDVLSAYTLKVADYSFKMQADKTKLYIKQDYTINLLKEGKVYAAIECNFAYYQDNDSDLTESSFKDNYLTDDVLKDTYYYDCDKQKVAADFMAGKEVVISPVGGYDASNVNINFSDENNWRNAPYICFFGIIDLGFPCGIAGSAYSEDEARIENGKLIIDSVNALKMAKDEAKEFAASRGNPNYDVDNAKMYLVITSEDNVKILFIPLN